MLDHAVQRDQIAVDVVEHLNLDRILEKEQRRRTAKRLDVAAVGRKQRQDLRRETALAAYPGDDGARRLERDAPGVVLHSSRWCWTLEALGV
eukprot:9780-Eustigmatos_ZCMA.PRE.1